ncbi:hypothetical protein CDAR_434621 [Caerostris darwini]|uniref:Uncharacterized protein n=1 Tax=Caerostris darwini TaxID=1538125 RepID=A0AAV4SSN9_9ARAC|nr:hypothetical protein CDAR_434621 [Caerostris darwini]
MSLSVYRKKMQSRTNDKEAKSRLSVSNNFGDATVLVIEATGVKIGCSFCIGLEVLSDLSLSSGGQIKPVISGSVITETDAAVGLCA